MPFCRAVGLMSGTSMDGVDVALVDTDGDAVVRLGAHVEVPYTPAERAVLRAALPAACGLHDRTARPGAIGTAEDLVTSAHAAAVAAFLRREGLDAAEIDVVGFHGQTILHRPERRLTIQIGDGPALARALGILVVHDFRAADVAVGGQGAPLVPVFHRALAAAAGLPRPLAILNLGGIGNLTFIAADGAMTAFDTGPGNALLDDAMMSRCGLPCDRDGRMALAGRCDDAVLAALMSAPFFARPVPKSLDRGDLSGGATAALSTPDAAATLVEFTAASVAFGVTQLPAAPRQMIVAGGGARNPAILAALRRRLGCPLRTAEEIGWSSGAMEAQAFAYLAVRRLADLPATYPGTTGVSAPLAAGVLSRRPPQSPSSYRS